MVFQFEKPYDDKDDLKKDTT